MVSAFTIAARSLLLVVVVSAVSAFKMARGAAKKTSVSLVAFTPTQEELAAARKILSTLDVKGHKSKDNAMRQFCLSNADAAGDNSSIVQSSGDKRAEYVCKYLAYQTAKKSGRLTTVRQNVNEDMKHLDVLRWNKFKCLKEVGLITFDAWIASKKLDYESDPVTGLATEDLRVYLVPTSWTRVSTGSKDHLQLDSEMAASAQDLANFESMRLADGGGSGSAGSSSGGGTIEVNGVIVKKEGATAVDELKAKVAEFTEARNEHLMSLSTTVTELQILSVTAASSKFTAPVADSATTLVAKVGKVKKGMEKWLMDPTSLKENGLETLMQQVLTVLAEKADLMKIAEKQGIAVAGSKKRKNA